MTVTDGTEHFKNDIDKDVGHGRYPHEKVISGSWPVLLEVTHTVIQIFMHEVQRMSGSLSFKYSDPNA